MTDPMSPERLAEFEAVEAAASAGPWVSHGWTADGPQSVDGCSELMISVDVGDPADAAFIAMARNAIPELIAEVRRLRDAVATKAAKSATATHDRRSQLLAAVRRQGGEWTPERVKGLYQRHGHKRLLRAAIRADLATLHRDGYLVLNETPGRRFYTPAKDGAK